MIRQILSRAFFGLALTATFPTQLPAQTALDPVQPVNIILDSDLAIDADDAGDHAMLWAMAARGEANVLALIVSATNDYSAACAQAIASYYGHPSVPIGANKSNIPNSYSSSFSYFTQQVSQQFGFPGKTRFYYPDAVTVYRQALSAAADHSVYIVGGGYYKALRDLLESGPDSISPLTGRELAALKVKRLIPATGHFPDSGNNTAGNLAVDADSASYVVANWPTEIVWVPEDQMADISTGPSFNADPNTNPVKLAYNLYCANGTNCPNTSGAWTQGGLLFAIRGGLSSTFSAGGWNGSSVVLDSTQQYPGRSIWSQTPDRQHGYVLRAIYAATMADLINPLIQWIPPRNSITKPPVADPQSLTTRGVPLAVVLTGSDSQGAPLAYFVATLPSHGTLSGTAPKLIYTPTPGYVGADSFTFWTSNGYYQSFAATVSINVMLPDRAPVANPQSVSGYGDPVSITLSAADPDGDPVTYSVLTQPAHGALSGTAPNLTYTSQTGYTGTDSFTFQASDGLLTSAPATVTITISSRPYRLRVNAGGPGFTDRNGNLWEADTGSNGGYTYSTASPITAAAGDPTLFQTERYGETSVQYNFASLPNGTYAVNLYFAEIASNCFHAGCRAFNVLVQGSQVLANFDPYAAAGGANIGIARSSTAVVSNGTLNITLQASLAPYPTISGIELILLPANSSRYGSISGTVTPAGTNTPIAGALVTSAMDSAITDNWGAFTIAALPPGAYGLTASSPGRLNSTQTVSVTAGATATANFALASGQAPAANPQSVTTPGLPIAIVLSGTDPQGAPLTYTVVTQPAHGALSGTAPNLTYTPTTGYVGTDSFTFRVNNGSQDSAPATVQITVTAGGGGGNTPPTANAQSVTVYGDATPITLTATDPDGDALTYAVVTQPAHGSLSGTAPNLTYTPQAGYNGADSFTFQASDGRLTSAAAIVSITVSSSSYRLRVNAGGPAVTDARGNAWQADTGYVGGTAYSTAAAVTATAGDPAIFQTQRYGDASLQYNFTNLPNGTYAVNLYFAELYTGCFAAGCRVFDVLVQGALVLGNFDIYSAAGGGNIGIARSARTVVTSGTLSITLQATLTRYPAINAIELVLLPANSSRHGSISGTVQQAGTSAPIPGAVVRSDTDSAITDNTGSYTLAHLLPATYVLTASSGGSQSVTSSVAVTAGTAATANFTLAPPLPALTAISPNSGAAGTNVSVTLTGSLLTGATLNIPPASGITLLSAPTVTATQITATFVIASTAPPGPVNITATTAAGSSGPVVFTVQPPAPVLTSITPATGAAGGTVPVVIIGTNLAGATLDGIPGLGVTGMTINPAGTQINANLLIPATAAPGVQSLFARTAGGSSNSLSFTIATPPPALTAITPASAGAGAVVAVTLTGANLLNASAIDSGTGIAISNLVAVNSTRVTATFIVAEGAAPGAHAVTITTPGGTSGPVTFTINPAAPALTSITPNSGAQGSSVAVTIAGNHLSEAVLNLPAGITTAGAPAVTAASITVTLNIASSAATGPRNITVTTAGGASNALVFTVNPPQQTPPRVSCSATPNTLWPADGKEVVVTVSGTVTAGSQAIPSGGTTYAVADEYGQVQPAGRFAFGSGGAYSFGVPLIAARDGNDTNGRTYTIKVTAQDQIGNLGSCSAVVTVPHSQGH